MYLKIEIEIETIVMLSDVHLFPYLQQNKKKLTNFSFQKNKTSRKKWSNIWYD